MPSPSGREILFKIKEDLPTLPGIVTSILNIVLDDKSSVTDIARVVRVDQILVSKVLRVVNSAAYSLREKVSTLEHAMGILGFDMLKKLFLSISIFDNLGEENLGCDFFNKSQFWCHSLAVGTVARNLASLIKYKSPNEAYVAGLLHDIGKIIIDQIMHDEYINYLEKLKLTPTLSLSLEEKNLFTNHAVVGKLATEKWNLPLALQKAIEFHHGTEKGEEELDELAAIVSVADFICWTQAIGSLNFFSQPTLTPQMERVVNLKDLQLGPVLEEMNKELAVNARIFNFQVTDLKEVRKALQRANLELGRTNSLYEEAKRKLERQIHELNTLNSIIYKAREILEPSKIIRNVLHGIHEGFGFSRFIWFSIDINKKMMITSAMCGNFQHNLPIITTGCSWDEEICRPLIHCLETKKIIHLQGDSDNTPAALSLLKSLQTSELLLVPVISGQTVTDLLLIDNSERTASISADTIRVLDILAVNLGMALENAKLFQQTAQLAIIDPLTDVYNRRQLDFSLTNEFNRSIRFHQPFSVVLFDIDYFKNINDTYGHQAGDLVLKDVAGIIKNNSRNIDIVGRFGGDEFLVILPNTQIQGTFIFAERIRLVVEKYGLLRQKNFPQCNITISIGLASFNETIDTPERLLNKADKALYRSKQKGRNKVSILEE